MSICQNFERITLEACLLLESLLNVDLRIPPQKPTKDKHPDAYTEPWLVTIAGDLEMTRSRQS
jgi:hypothetical protein